MVGVILGAVLVVGVAKMLRRRAWYRGLGCAGYGGYPGFRFGHGFGHGPDFDDFDDRRVGPGFARFGARGGGWPLRSLFQRLETTPGQERAILAALDELRENRRGLREELRQTRADIARALEGGLIEDSTLEDAFARQDRLLARLRVSFTEALKKVAEALDERQRKQLASWLEGGFFRGGWGGGGPVWA